MKIIAIIQARMSSSRLPKKVLLPILGKSVLEHIIFRVNLSKRINNIVVATSDDKSDNLIVNLCTSLGVDYYRGSLNDVLDRFYKAALKFNADAVLRITGDCPVIDYEIIDKVILDFCNNNFDLYGLGGEFPDGLDCTIIKFSALKEAWEKSKLNSEREHVCPYIEKRPADFKIGSYNKFKNLSHLRWTLDEEKDYQLIKKIYKKLYYKNKKFKSNDILKLLKNNPSLSEINSDILRNEGYLESLKKDS